MSLNYKHSGLLILFVISLIFSSHAQNQLTNQTPAESAELSEAEKAKVISEMTNAVSKIKSFRTDITQQRHIALFEEVLISKGNLFFYNPDKLRWEIYDPFISIMIYNNNAVAKFDMSDGKLRKLKLGTEEIIKEFLKQILSWMTGSFGKESLEYSLKIFRGENLYFQLIPKAKEVEKYLKSINIEVEEKTYQIKKVIINENDGDYTEILFSNGQKDIDIEDSVFDLNNPLIEENIHDAKK